jgi:AcrR family transcriptional regulator
VPTRTPLSRDRIHAAALQLADRDGLRGLSMRAVAQALGVEAMSLYHHVRGKEALLDGLVDAVFAEFHLPVVGGDWREEMRSRSRSAREAMKRHPWAIGLMDSRRTPGPETLRHHDAVLGCLRTAGFPVVLASHAYSVLDAYVYGFVLTELNLPMEAGEDAQEFAAGLALAADDYPHLVETMVVQLSGGTYDYAAEFDWGLDLVLDGLEERLARSVGESDD